jgi:hypothetical protein
LFSPCCSSVAAPRQRTGNEDQVPAKNNEWRRGHWLRHHGQSPATHLKVPPRVRAWAPRPTTCAAPQT